MIVTMIIGVLGLTVAGLGACVWRLWFQLRAYHACNVLAVVGLQRRIDGLDADSARVALHLMDRINALDGVVECNHRLGAALLVEHGHGRVQH